MFCISKKRLATLELVLTWYGTIPTKILLIIVYVDLYMAYVYKCSSCQPFPSVATLKKFTIFLLLLNRAMHAHTSKGHAFITSTPHVGIMFVATGRLIMRRPPEEVALYLRLYLICSYGLYLSASANGFNLQL